MKINGLSGSRVENNDYIEEECDVTLLYFFNQRKEIKMLKREYLELHKKLKERIKGRIYIGVENNEAMVNIKGFKGITYRFTINDKDCRNTEDLANKIENRYRKFLLNKFFERREK